VQGSFRRVAPQGDIALGGALLPEGARWRNVEVAVGKGGGCSKTVTYQWGVSRNGNPLCKRCMTDLGSKFFHVVSLSHIHKRTFLSGGVSFSQICLLCERCMTDLEICKFSHVVSLSHMKEHVFLTLILAASRMKEHLFHMTEHVLSCGIFFSHT